MATPYEVISNYKEWIAKDDFREAVKAAAARLGEDGVEGVYLVCPSIDGRPVGKFLATGDFERVVSKGMRLHPQALTDFRPTLTGEAIGYKEEEPEGTMVPDLTTLRTLPWEPRLARVFCYYYDSVTGELQDHCSRGTLARHEHAFREETGAGMKVGIEPELMWLRKNAEGGLEHTTSPLAFYEMAYMEELEPIMLDLIEWGRGMGLEITHADAEDASQVELNQAPGFALEYVDRFYTYRQLCRIVARKHGLIATFMAKPFMGLSANGHHHNLSLANGDGENVLVGEEKGDCRLSEMGMHFIGGLLDHADANTLIGSPTANSYKRFWDVGLWAPFHKSYGFNNRSCLFRVSDVGRLEARGPDASCNPYLTVSAFLVAGLDGIRRKLDPGEPIQDNMMKDLGIPREERIPITLTEAIEAFKADDLMRDVFAPRLYETFTGLRQDDLDRYWSHVSQWELDFYLERWP